MINTIKNIFTSRPQATTEELGVAGAKISNGYVHEEFLTSLQGERGRRMYREMADNDAVIGATLFAVELILRATKWRIDENEETAGTPQSEEAKAWLEGVIFEDMEHTWDDTMAEILSMLVFGWQYTEMVFKRRIGPNQLNLERRSNFTDGTIGIRKLANRSQETLDRWEIDDKGNIMGMWQYPPLGGTSIFIPMWKSILFRPHLFKGSPEGKSVLRRAYRSYYFLKNLQEIEAMGIERELNGLPVLYVPNQILTSKEAAHVSTRQKYEKVVRDIKLNNQAGLVLPSNTYYDSEGRPSNIKQVELKLLASEGSRSIDINPTILRYQRDIARTILADVIMLGSTSAGSLALSNDKSSMFYNGIVGWADSIADTSNRCMVRTLWVLNGFDPQYMPGLAHGDIAPIDLEKLGNFIRDLSGAGANLFPDDDLENELRSTANLPPKNPMDPELNEDDPVNMNQVNPLPGEGGGDEI